MINDPRPRSRACNRQFKYFNANRPAAKTPENRLKPFYVQVELINVQINSKERKN